MTAAVHFERGLAEERAVFQRLRVSREAFALRHQFFAERESAKHPALDGVAPREVRRIAVIGAGTMGSGIAIAALDAGYEVLLLEQDGAALERGAVRIREHYAGRVRAGKLKAAAAARSEARLGTSLDWPAIATADLVIEAVYVAIPDMPCEAGRLGRKTAAGYYRYTESGMPEVDGAVHTIIGQCRADKGLQARSFTDEEIVRRALLAIVNEAAHLLAEGVAERATDVDVVLVNGYGFPRWEGGPVFWARERGETALADDLGWLAALSGPGFVAGDPRRLMQEET